MEILYNFLINSEGQLKSFGRYSVTLIYVEIKIIGSEFVFLNIYPTYP